MSHLLISSLFAVDWTALADRASRHENVERALPAILRELETESALTAPRHGSERRAFSNVLLLVYVRLINVWLEFQERPSLFRAENYDTFFDDAFRLETLVRDLDFVVVRRLQTALSAVSFDLRGDCDASFALAERAVRDGDAQQDAPFDRGLAIFWKSVSGYALSKIDERTFRGRLEVSRMDLEKLYSPDQFPIGHLNQPLAQFSAQVLRRAAFRLATVEGDIQKAREARDYGHAVPVAVPWGLLGLDNFTTSDAMSRFATVLHSQARYAAELIVRERQLAEAVEHRRMPAAGRLPPLREFELRLNMVRAYHVWGLSEDAQDTLDVAVWEELESARSELTFGLFARAEQRLQGVAKAIANLQTLGFRSRYEPQLSRYLFRIYAEQRKMPEAFAQLKLLETKFRGYHADIELAEMRRQLFTPGALLRYCWQAVFQQAGSIRAKSRGRK
jgi:hypothetical protein